VALRPPPPRNAATGGAIIMMRTLMPLLLLGCWAPMALATVLLPKWFGDGMVLQASDSSSGGGGPPAFLSGQTLPPGEAVAISGDVGKYSIVSDTGTGLWKVALGPSSGWSNARTGMTISVRGATGAAVVARSVLAGDVFFCAGQSNMLFSLHQAINYTAEAATLANYPHFRFFMANRALNATPQFDLTTNNQNCDAAAPAPPPGPPAVANMANASASLCVASGFLHNTAFGHGDGPSIGRAATTNAADCCAQCSSGTWSAKGCLFFTWHPPAAVGGTGMCYFKNSARGPTLPRPGYISGGTGGPPPPPRPCNRWLTAAEASSDGHRYLLSFSAVCFLTIRDVAAMHTGERPMGLVQAAWGGSRIEVSQTIVCATDRKPRLLSAQLTERPTPMRH
jgi:hypothetical protein